MIKKIFPVFLIVSIFFLSSCEDSSVPVIYDFRNSDVAENIAIETESGPTSDLLDSEEKIEIITEIPEIIEPAKEKERELIYNAPYTADEIKNIFDSGKELFEKIKDIKMPDGYNYFIAEKYPSCRIDFYDCNNTDNHISYDIDKNSEYKLIPDLFDRYEHIFYINAIDPDSENYSDENIIALFKIQMILPDSESGYIPWAEIRYNRNSGEIEEKTTGGYMIIPLDEHWYYIYGNIWLD